METKFDEKGLIPVIAQDYKDGTVLMLAYMNKELNFPSQIYIQA